ncbi:FadR family transcriptional regulator [Paraburkholderia aspalathi]|nr:FadR family transcriptional regulator [Paraburkholderia aspalathi]
MKLLKQLQKVEVTTSSDQIIQQLRTLIAQGVIKPGERLPSERSLAEEFGVGRSAVREALRKLEFFGILRTRPQSGTTVEDMSTTGLSGLITNVLALADPDPSDMVEARRVLEVQIARIAAERADPAGLIAIRTAHENHAAATLNGEASIESDVLFHLSIAEATRNEVLHSMVTVFAPRIIVSAKESRTCEDGRALKALEEHAAILDAIERGDPDAAEDAMHRHLVMTRSRYGELDTNIAN